MSCKPTLYKTGVYEIVNIITNERCIGSASRIGKSSSLSGFYVRFEKHKNYLQNNTHYNTHLQRAWNKYGESNFKFNILVTCPKEYCIKLEQWFIDNLKPEYNIRLKDYNRVLLENVYDGINKPIPVHIINPRNTPIKSIFYNNGKFDLTNPNIYKSVLPVTGASLLLKSKTNKDEKGKR